MILLKHWARNTNNIEKIVAAQRTWSFHTFGMVVVVLVLERRDGVV